MRLNKIASASTAATPANQPVQAGRREDRPDDQRQRNAQFQCGGQPLHRAISVAVVMTERVCSHASFRPPVIPFARFGTSSQPSNSASAKTIKEPAAPAMAVAPTAQ